MPVTIMPTPAHEQRCIHCTFFRKTNVIKDGVFGGQRVLGNCEIRGEMDGQGSCLQWRSR